MELPERLTLHEHIERGLTRPGPGLVDCPVCGVPAHGWNLKHPTGGGPPDTLEQGEASLTIVPCGHVVWLVGGVWQASERTLAARVESALDRAARYADVPLGALQRQYITDQKAWVIDRMVHELLDDGYDAWRAQRTDWQDGTTP